MSVSAGAGGLDIDAVVSGGEPFIRRLTELQTAATAYQKQVEDLKLGKAALVAYDEARALLADARKKVQDAEAEAARIIGDAQRKADEFHRSVSEAKASLRDAMAMATKVPV